MITLEVKKFEKNENFEKEMKEYQSGYWYSNRWNMPEKSKEVNALSVAITEEQFEAIRKAVLEVF